MINNKVCANAREDFNIETFGLILSAVPGFVRRSKLLVFLEDRIFLSTVLLGGPRQRLRYLPRKLYRGGYY